MGELAGPHLVDQRACDDLLPDQVGEALGGNAIERGSQRHPTPAVKAITAQRLLHDGHPKRAALSQ